ncbi:MAG TPA: hypothetical protein VFQ39_14360, partial [Longimicrobium sp.]|nr:hypothetical protein [Longimicrobium sp.]
RWLDQLIYTFDLIGQVLRMKAVTANEVQIFAFQASRVLRNSEVRKYLEWLDREYERENRPTPAHADARYLAAAVLKSTTQVQSNDRPQKMWGRP